MSDFTNYWLMFLLACGVVLLAAWILRGAVASGVALAAGRVEKNRSSQAAAEAERQKRLLSNPWSTAGFNMTRQIEMIRHDFEGALRTAAEAGVNISHLRGCEHYIAPLAVPPTPQQERIEAVKNASPKYKDGNVDPTYFGMKPKRKPAKRKAVRRG